MGSIKGPSSDNISASSRVVPEGDATVKETPFITPDKVEMPTPQEEAELLAKLTSPVIPPPDCMAIAKSEPSASSGPARPQIHLQAQDINDEGADNSDATTKQMHPDNDGKLDTMRSIEFTDEISRHRSWKIIGKLALLAKSMNAHTIDIYHDRKLNTGRFMIHPNSTFRRAWEVITVCLVIYVCTVVSSPAN
ncbi:unnamed protein product [Phytophthora fragariaefolia]|uniref:Unnamed protein product n=1 Tax=Phytophthora fragariaefolia TaxID=1490495 RepID=A0A9W7DA72_9STRA|nr:unnamed protein product [Phytophthora fragariaefolia]